MKVLTLRCVAVTATLVLLSASAFAEQPQTAGRIKIVSGSASVTRGSTVMAATLGQPVFEGDLVWTGPDGRLALTLTDDTRLSLGPSTEMQIRRFAYAPAQGRLALALRVVRGVAAYVSGRIATLSPDAVSLEAPGAIVGVRGTTVGIRVIAP